MITLVVDASVCLKWAFNDEIDSDLALTLQKNYFLGNINLISPTLWIYEIINSLKSASLKKPEISSSELTTKLHELTNFCPNLFDVSDLANLILKYSFLFNISAYDSAYVTLAHAHGLTLITADSKLAAKINDPKLAISLKAYYNNTN